MSSEALAVLLFLVGAVIGVVSGWVKPPKDLSSRAILGILALLLIAGSAVVYAQARADDDGAAAVAQPISTTSKYVSADRWRPVGAGSQQVNLMTTGNDVTIMSPAGDSPVGVALPDHNWCADGSVTFVLRLAGGSGTYGFGVLPSGTLTDTGEASGGAMLFFRDSDGTFIAKYSGLPTPFLGGVGGGAYAVAAFTTRREVTLEVKDGTYNVLVDGTRAGDFAQADEPSCGQLMFVAWGGVSATIDHVLLR